MFSEFGSGLVGEGFRVVGGFTVVGGFGLFGFRGLGFRVVGSIQ